jgi:hypothetical protein
MGGPTPVRRTASHFGGRWTSLVEDTCVQWLETLLKDGRADPRTNGSEILARAARRRNEKTSIKAVKLPLEDGRADPSANFPEALRVACEEGRAEVVEMLLQDGRVDPGAKDGHALAVARDKGRADVVALLESWLVGGGKRRKV